MTPAYDPKSVAVSALALACFSVGFSVTAAAYLSSHAAPPTEVHATSGAAHAAAALTREPARGCRLGG